MLTGGEVAGACFDLLQIICFSCWLAYILSYICFGSFGSSCVEKVGLTFFSSRGLPYLCSPERGFLRN